MSDWVQHHYSHEERRAFVDFINQLLTDDPVVGSRIPINPDNDDFFSAVNDGLILCKMLGKCVPGSVDEKKLVVKENLNQFEKAVNHDLFLETCKQVGVKVVSIGSSELIAGKPHLVLGLVWQVIKLSLFSQVFSAHPELVLLLDAGMKPSDLLKMGEETVVLRWINWHLANKKLDIKVSNFSDDIKSGVVYCELFNALGLLSVPIESTHAMTPSERANLVLDAAKGAKAAKFVTNKDIIDGNARLNFAFCANLFALNPMLPSLTDAYMETMTSERNLQTKAAELEETKKTVVSLKEDVTRVTSSSSSLEEENARLRKENAELKEQIAALKNASSSSSSSSGAAGSSSSGAPSSSSSSAGGGAAAGGAGHSAAGGRSRSGNVTDPSSSSSPSSSAAAAPGDGRYGRSVSVVGRVDLREGGEHEPSERELQLEKMLRLMEREVEKLKELLQIQIEEKESAAQDAASSRLAAAKLQETFAEVTSRLDEVRQQLDQKERETQDAIARAKGAQSAYEHLSSSVKAQKEGFLRKQGRGFKSWKKRYFSLRGHLLFYFSDEAAAKAKKPLGVVYVDEYVFTETAKEDQPNLLLLQHKTLSEGEKGYQFLMEAQDAADFSAWMDALKRVM